MTDGTMCYDGLNNKIANFLYDKKLDEKYTSLYGFRLDQSATNIERKNLE